MKTKLSFPVAALIFLFIARAATAADASPLLEGYFTVTGAMVSDDLATARASAGNLAQKAHAAGNHALAEHATKLAAAETMSDAREALKALSNDAIGLARGLPGYYVMTCSMVKADWLQNTKEIANPYGGKAMPKCGSLKGN